MQQATLPSKSTAATEESPITDLGEAIEYEDRLAQSGLQYGEIDHGLEAAGWAQPVIRRDGNADPIAYDV